MEKDADAKGGVRREEITRAMADAARPAAQIYRINDTGQPGLCLRVHPSGRKVWNLNWTRNRSLRLGLYPHVTVTMARERARALLVERDQQGAPAAALPAAAGAQTLLRDFVANHYAAYIRARRKRAEADLADMKALFGEAFYPLPLGAITVSAVEAWATARRAGGAKESTVRRNLVRLKAMLSKATEWGAMPVSPLAKLRLGRDVPSGADIYLDAEEEKSLRAALADRDARMIAARASGNAWAVARGMPPLAPLVAFGDHLTPLVLLAMNTGLRRGELTSLRWENSGLDTGVIVVLAANAKSGKARFVPLNDEAAQLLRTWREVTPHDGARVFPLESPKTAWNALVDAAGIGKFRFHDLRHHFASRLVMAGIDLNTVRELLGHSDIKTTLRYAHLAPQHKANAVQALLVREPAPKPPVPAPEPAAEEAQKAELRALLKQLAAKL